MQRILKYLIITSHFVQLPSWDILSKIIHNRPSVLQSLAIMVTNSWSGKPLSLKIIGTNSGTSMDGLDIVHVHYTQESPEAPLKIKLLRAGEVSFDGQLKSEYTAFTVFDSYHELIREQTAS